MGAFNVVTGSWAAAATGTIGLPHGITGMDVNSDSFVAIFSRTANAGSATTPPNATNFFVSRTATTSGSVTALIGTGVRSGQY